MAVVLPSDFETRISEAISAIEAAIAALTGGNTGAALDDLLAARLILTAVRATPGRTDASG